MSRPDGKKPPLDLDLETAPDAPPRPLGLRAYVGGVLCVEGLVVLGMGLSLLVTYWFPSQSRPAAVNPVARLGFWLVYAALIYMVVVGLALWVHRTVRPAARPEPDSALDSGVVSRARRYASMRKRTYYIFDNTLHCARDAEEAMEARRLY